MELIVKISGISRKQITIITTIKLISMTRLGCVAVHAGWHGLSLLKEGGGQQRL